MLDRTQRRIVGVLIEKALTVPDTYPLSEKAIVAGCNQTNNRDPVMELQTFEVAGALMALSQQGWVARVEGGSRVTKYRHKVVERLGVSETEVAVLCELMLRGAQAPGALKPRVARMGCEAEVADLQEVLEAMRARPQPLVEELSLAPRERHRRWRHLLGDEAGSGEGESLDGGVAAEAPSNLGADAQNSGSAVGSAAVAAMPVKVSAEASLVERVAELERQVAALQAELARLRSS